MTAGRVIALVLIIWSQVLLGVILALSESVPDISSGAGIEYNAENLSDPFFDYKAEKMENEARKPVELKPLPPLNVLGMIWGGNFPQAIINNRIVKLGDTVEGVRIKEINKDGITVIYNEQVYKLDSPANINYGSIIKESQKGEQNEK